MTSIAIIGGGPGGYVAAIRAAQLGAKVTLIEKEKIGGTCLNVGCIPTKAMLESAHLYDMVKDGKKRGVIAEPKLDFTGVQKSKATAVRRLVNGVTATLKSNGIEIISGTASFKDGKTITVDTAEGVLELSPDKVIIAAGSVPAMPPIPGLDGKNCITSTGALDLTEVPETMAIIGGGVIGVEIGSIYRSFGTKVDVIEMMPVILPMMDGELTGEIRKKLIKKGIGIHTSAKVVSVEEDGDKSKVNVEMDGEMKAFICDKVLVAVGRRTNTEGLGLERAGVIHDRGRITVDQRMCTSNPDIYAVGDCIGKTMLAHTASVMGECAAENAMGHNSTYDEKTNPSCVYTEPEFASVGLTEEKAKEKGIAYIKGTFPLTGNGKAMIMNGGEGLIKILADPKYKEILGVHILGPRATDLIAEAALALRLEATVDELITTIHAHPTLAEAVREAAMDVLGSAIHKAKE